MRMLLIRNAVVLFLLSHTLILAQTLSPDVMPFVKVNSPLVALTHVRVVDGTGSPAREDQSVLVSKGKIEWVGDAIRGLTEREGHRDFLTRLRLMSNK